MKICATVLRLAERAFFPERVPFTLLHIDTEHNFPEVVTFRDRLAATDIPENALRQLSMGMSHDYEAAVERCDGDRRNREAQTPTRSSALSMALPGTG